MSKTNFNALRMEAADLEKEANAMLSRAQQLRAQADEQDPNVDTNTGQSTSDGEAKSADTHPKGPYSPKSASK